MKKFWLSLLLLTPVSVGAVLPHGATPAEEAMCEARGMPGGQGQYQGHYCDGLRFFNRAYSSMRNKRDMKYYLDVAIDNFNYVLGQTKEGDVLRGEVHVEKARALKLLGRNAEAVAEFNKALQYKLDSPEIYRALADHYFETGNKQKALELVTEGLQKNPGSKGLKRRYTEYGGKLPYPVSVDRAIPAEAAKSDIQPVVKLEAESPSTVPIGPTPQIDTPQIGSPTNPYCRFCPD